MTSHSRIDQFIDVAFSKASPLCRAQFGDVVANIIADPASCSQGFEQALLPSTGTASVAFAIVSGPDPILERMVPHPADRSYVLSHPDLYVHWWPYAEPMLSVFHRTSGRGVTWFPDVVAAPWAIGQPCIPLIHAVITDSDWCLAHAGAVGRNGQFLLLLGPGGAGKSTATLACLRAGWDYSGDDFVLLNPRSGLVAPLFSSARIRHSGAAAFESLIGDTVVAVSDDDGAPRYELRLPLMPVGGRVAKMLALERSGAKCPTFKPARISDFLGPLVQVSMARAPGYAGRTSRKLLAAARMAPALVADTGTDPAAIPASLSDLLEDRGCGRA
jgi:hypothetical protein